MSAGHLTNGSKACVGTNKAARRKRFEDMFPVIADELLGYVKGEGMPKDALDWYEKVSFAQLSLSLSSLKRRCCQPTVGPAKAEVFPEPAP